MATKTEAKKEKKEPQIKSSVLKVKKEKVDLRKEEKPLVDVKVTNPITYIKSWWRKIIGKEGIELKIKVRPLTAIAIAIIVVTVTLGIGYFKFPFKIPFFEYKVKEEALPKIFFRETAFSGTLSYDQPNEQYYLITESAEAIKLEVPENIDLKDFIGRRILTTGKYYQDTRTLKVYSASDLELLPKESETIPTTVPTAPPEPTATPLPTNTPTPSPEPEETPAVSI